LDKIRVKTRVPNLKKEGKSEVSGIMEKKKIWLFICGSYTITSDNKLPPVAPIKKKEEL